jgi:hypothetical protein
MGLKTLVLGGTALATLTVGLATPAIAATQAVSTRTPAVASQASNDDNDISGLVQESPVCSALGAETIPTGSVVAKCLAGTKLI